MWESHLITIIFTTLLSAIVAYLVMYQQKKLQSNLTDEINIRTETEISLIESEERLRIVTDSTRSAFIIIDNNNLVISWNKAAERIFGYCKAESLNQNIFSLIVPKEKKAEYEELMLSLKGSAKSALIGNTVELQAKDKNGRIFPIELSVSTIVIKGEIYVTGLINDISKRIETEKALAESEENLRQLVEKASIGIYRTTPDGKIMYANPYLVNILGYNSLEELQSVNLEKEGFESIEKRRKFKEKIETNGDISSYNSSYLRSDKSKIYVNEYARCVRDESGEVKYYEGMIADVTDRRMAEKELIRSESLLRELNSTKDRFFSIIAHDLKNPLSNCVMANNMLHADWNTFDENERMKLIEHMQSSSKNLLQLLENLLTWASSQRNDIVYSFTIFDIHDLVFDNLELSKMNANNKGIKLISEINEKTIVFADYNMISTVVRNLISNAIKFTSPGGSVVVSSNNFNDEKFITVSVKDTGIGMGEKDISRLFRLDVRQSTLGTSNEKGTGLGLIICKDFVEKNGGNIWIDSEVGKGSTFSFTVQKNPDFLELEKKSTSEDVDKIK